MIVGVPKETCPTERRVAIVPSVVPSLIAAGLETCVESNAGEEAGFPDTAYLEKNAKIVASRAELFAAADVMLQVRTPGANPQAGQADLDLLRPGQVVIGLADPLSSAQRVQALAGRGVTAFSLELMPRISRAQAMDAMSSQAMVAGYKAVLLAAAALPRLFPLMMTAAGTLTATHLFVIGAGVAGLQAVATGKRLGALVEAYDVRPAVKEQIQSVGAKFVELPIPETQSMETAGGYAKAMDEDFYRRQRELMTQVVARNDVVIATAVVPGRKAPVLVTGEMVAGMTPGSVIVDLAADQGGNCELTRPGQTIVEHRVTIIGATHLAATVPHHASQMYARNISVFLLHLLKDGKLALDMQDEITRETLITRDGQVVHPRLRELSGLPAPAAQAQAKSDDHAPTPPQGRIE